MLPILVDYLSTDLDYKESYDVKSLIEGFHPFKALKVLLHSMIDTKDGWVASS